MKALTAIVELRTLASEIAQFPDVREYYWALMLESLVTKAQSIDTNQQNQSILLASVVADRLIHFQDEWDLAKIEWTTWEDRPLRFVRRRKEEEELSLRVIHQMSICKTK